MLEPGTSRHVQLLRPSAWGCRHYCSTLWGVSGAGRWIACALLRWRRCCTGFWTTPPRSMPSPSTASVRLARAKGEHTHPLGHSSPQVVLSFAWVACSEGIVTLISACIGSSWLCQASQKVAARQLAMAVSSCMTSGSVSSVALLEYLTACGPSTYTLWVGSARGICLV